MEKEKVDKVTYCLTGSPKPYWKIKADFMADMEKWGYFCDVVRDKDTKEIKIHPFIHLKLFTNLFFPAS